MDGEHEEISSCGRFVAVLHKYCRTPSFKSFAQTEPLFVSLFVYSQTWGQAKHTHPLSTQST